MKTVHLLEDKFLSSVLEGNLNAIFRDALRAAGQHVRSTSDVEVLIHNLQDGDVVALLTPWDGRALELAYYRDVIGHVDFKIAALLLDVGSYDQARGPEPRQWQAFAEKAALAAFDLVMVESREHLSKLAKAYSEFDTDEAKVVGGLVEELFITERVAWQDRRKRVFYPYMGDSHEGLNEYKALEAAYRKAYPDEEVEFGQLCTPRGQGVYEFHVQDRDELVREYMMARVVFSASTSNVFPRQLFEASQCNARVLAPDREAFAETLPAEALYSSPEEAVEKLHAMLNEDKKPAALTYTPPVSMRDAFDAM